MSEKTDSEKFIPEMREQLNRITTQTDSLKQSAEHQLIYATNEEILVRIPGLYLLFPASQLNHALSFLDPTFDRGLIHFLAHTLKPEQIFVDIGANIGTFTALAARNLGPGGRIITAEPIPELEPFIRRNAFLNGPTAVVEQHSCAISNYTGEMILQQFDLDSRVSTLFPYQDEKARRTTDVKVRVMSAADLIPSGTEDMVIKIDAEGAEFNILSSLFSHPEKLQGRSTQIILEYGVTHFERTEQSTKDFIALINAHGLSAHFIHDQSGVLGAQLSTETEHLSGNLVIEIASDHFQTLGTDLVGTYRKEFEIQLTAMLDRPVAKNEIQCRCCGAQLDLKTLQQVTSVCMFTDKTLERFECSGCGVIFGPVSLIECSAEELADLYTALYKFSSEGASESGQEKTFYLLNPSRFDHVLNYACGDWDHGRQRLEDLGWKVTGFEPAQENSSENNLSSKFDLEGRKFDKLFSHNYLEHVQDPAEFFSECRSLVCDDGSMAHSTPCYSFLFDQSPFHLFFYCGESVTHLAVRTGFSVTAHYSSDTEAEKIGSRYECYVFDKT